MKKSIVTGANGFVGRWLVKELILQGVDVIGVVHNEKSNITELQQFENVKIIICPLEKIGTLPFLIKDDNIDVFYHLAWDGTSGINRSDIRRQLSNVQAACDAVQAASEIGCLKFVNAGSIMEYEAMQYILKDGTTPGLGNIYSAAKVASDFMAKTLATNLKLPYVTAIISNIYGTGEKSERFINTTLKKLLNNEKTAFSHGLQLYDFIYASDAAKAFYIIGDRGKPNNSYYIGNSKPHPLKKFIVQMRDLVNKDIQLNFGEIPFQGALLKYNEFDTAKMNKEFGFEAEVSFEQGIKETIQWIQKNS